MAATLTGDDERKITRILADLIKQSEADECMVCDAGGHVLAQESSGRSSDPFSVSALGAGVFGASRQLAMILGEDEFSAVFHQGEKKSLFIRAVGEDTLLLSIFSDPDAIGLVKLYSEPAASSLRALFDDAEKRGSQIPTEDFRPFVLSKDENIFRQTQ